MQFITRADLVPESKRGETEMSLMYTANVVSTMINSVVFFAMVLLKVY